MCPAVGCPLDRRVRPLVTYPPGRSVEKRPVRPCVQQGNANAARQDMHAHERHSVRDPAVRGNPKLHWPGKTCMNGAFNGRSCLTTLAVAAAGRTPQANCRSGFSIVRRKGGKVTRSLSIALPTVAAATEAFRLELPTEDTFCAGAKRRVARGPALEAMAVSATRSRRICDASVHCGLDGALLFAHEGSNV